jgi:hypothetical protein
MYFHFFNQQMHFLFSYFRSIHPTHVSTVTLPSSRYIDKFTSLFTGPFDIITTVTMFKAIFYIDNHRYTKFLQAFSWNVLVCIVYISVYSIYVALEV